MYYGFRLWFALALGLALMAGCSDENGQGGSGAAAGTGGSAGAGGTGGTAGTGGVGGTGGVAGSGGTGGIGGEGGSGGSGGGAGNGGIGGGGGCVHGALEQDAITCINGEAPATDAGTVYFSVENCADAANTVYDLSLANADGVTQVYLWAGIENAGCWEASKRSDQLDVCREVVGNPRVVGPSVTVFGLTLEELVGTGIVNCNNMELEGQLYEIYSFRNTDPGGTDVDPSNYGVAPFKVVTLPQ